MSPVWLKTGRWVLDQVQGCCTNNPIPVSLVLHSSPSPPAGTAPTMGVPSLPSCRELIFPGPPGEPQPFSSNLPSCQPLGLWGWIVRSPSQSPFSALPTDKFSVSSSLSSMGWKQMHKCFWCPTGSGTVLASAHAQLGKKKVPAPGGCRLASVER